MNDTKYVRTNDDDVIIFPTSMEHSTFKHLGIESAGFISIDKDSVSCYGKSISLGLESKPSIDNLFAHQTVFGNTDDYALPRLKGDIEESESTTSYMTYFAIIITKSKYLKQVNDFIHEYNCKLDPHYNSFNSDPIWSWAQYGKTHLFSSSLELKDGFIEILFNNERHTKEDFKGLFKLLKQEGFEPAILVKGKPTYIYKTKKEIKEFFKKM